MPRFYSAKIWRLALLYTTLGRRILARRGGDAAWNQKKKQGKSSANSPCNAAAGREVQRVKRFKLRFPGWDNLEAVLVREQSAFAI